MGVVLELLPSCKGLIPVMGMRGGGFGTSPVVIPYRGVEAPGDVLEGLGGDFTLICDAMECPPCLTGGDTRTSMASFCGKCSPAGTSTFLAAAATSTKVAKAAIGEDSTEDPALSSLERCFVSLTNSSSVSVAVFSP